MVCVESSGGQEEGLKSGPMGMEMIQCESLI